MLATAKAYKATKENILRYSPSCILWETVSCSPRDTNLVSHLFQGFVASLSHDSTTITNNLLIPKPYENLTIKSNFKQSNLKNLF